MTPIDAAWARYMDACRIAMAAYLDATAPSWAALQAARDGGDLDAIDLALGQYRRLAAVAWIERCRTADAALTAWLHARATMGAS